MISYADIQIAYNQLYKEIRKYFWDFPAVEALSNLEVACYKTCQDLPEIRLAFDKLCKFTEDIQIEDEDLDKVVTKFKDLIDSDDTTYVKLNKVNEVISYEDNKETY